MIILYILGYIILFILVIILALILIPYSYHLEMEKEDQVKMGACVCWLFGGLKIIVNMEDWMMKTSRISILGLQKDMDLDKLDKDKNNLKRKNKSVNKHKDEKIEEGKKNKKTVKIKNFNRKIIIKLLETVKKAWRHIRPNTIYAKLVGGFEDPVYTGLLCGLLSQSWLLDDRYKINFQPSFEEDSFIGKVIIKGRIWLPYILIMAIKLVVTRPVRNMVFAGKRKKQTL